METQITWCNLLKIFWATKKLPGLVETDRQLLNRFNTIHLTHYNYLLVQQSATTIVPIPGNDIYVVQTFHCTGGMHNFKRALHLKDSRADT